MKKYTNPWKTLSSKYVYTNQWMKVREDKVILPTGKKGIYGVIERQPSIFIVPVLPNGDIVLVGQYRYPTKRYSWEIPAGASDGQRPLVAAKRELWEETGYKAKQWKRMGEFQVANGIMDLEAHVFLAEGLSLTSDNKMVEDGIEKMETFSLNKCFAMIDSGLISDGQTIVALFCYLRYCKKI